MLRFHLLGLPHTQVTRSFTSCAFTNKIFYFAKMLRSLGHEVFLYAGDQCETDVSEHIVCFSEADRLAHCNGTHYTAASWDTNDPGWKTFNTRCITEITKRAKPQDFICIMGGTAQKPVADALPAFMAVEYGIGHPGSFSSYRVFESYAWMHTTYGAETYGHPGSADGRWFDAVIPGYFDTADFPLSSEKDDYFLFIGRLTARKGPHIAAEVCQHLGKRLLIAGQGKPPSYGEYIGVVGHEERGRLMARAKAVFVPTVYIEPFGNVAVEAQACGTPVITTDWGAFTETVEHGLTGFRCRTFQEFCDATEACESLDASYIRNRASATYSLPVIAQQYDVYFKRLLTLWGKGWYETDLEGCYAGAGQCRV
jgi:glycosyltransferase involved in cell wall biosynthesis